MDSTSAAAKVPLVTIAIACQGDEASIDAAIASARAQDWPNVEIIVPAATRGYAAAINAAVAEARGEFVAVFDGTDTSRPDRISRQVARLTNYEDATGAELVLCYANRDALGADGVRTDTVRAIGRTPREPHGRSVADFVLWHDADPRFVWGHFVGGTRFARLRTLRAIGPLDENLARGSEWDLAVRAALAGGHFIAVDESLTARTLARSDEVDRLDVTRRLQSKHRAYLRARGVAAAAGALSNARRHHEARQPLRAFAFLALASLLSPFVVFPHELRRLNRRHALDIPGMAHNAAFLFGLRAIQGVLRLVTLHFVVKALTQTQFGQYQFTLSCVGLLTILSLPGLVNVVAQAAARRALGCFRGAASLSFLGSMAGALVLAGFGAYHYWQGAAEVAAGFFLAAAFFPPAYGMTLWRPMRIGQEDFSGLFVWDGITNIVSALLTIGAVLLWPGSFLAPLAVMLVVQATFNLVLTRVAVGRIPADAPSEPGAIRYGVRTTAYAALDIGAREIDRVLVATVLSPASLAIFVAAERVPELFKGVVQDVAGLLTPRFAKRARYTQRLDGVLRAFGVGVGALVVVAAFTVLPWFLVLIFGEAYRPAIPYAQALMCSVAIGSAAVLRQRYITSQLDEVGARVVSVSMSITRIVASAILVPWLGILGAVISAILYRITLAVVIHRVVARRYLGDEER